MVLLSQMFRTAAVTGRPDRVHAWFADRQGGRWAEQAVQAAIPMRPAQAQSAPRDHAETLRELQDLHQRGVVNEAELERLRSRLRV